MGRTLSPTMTQIFSREKREIDWTLEVTFPDSTFFRFATAPLVVGGNSYSNDLESVGELRQTMEAPADRVAVGIQNKDRVLGLHVAEHWQKWRKAEAVVGRLYYEIVNNQRSGVTEWKEMFRGSVQQPNANDFQVTFDILHDTLAPGQIVCTRTLALPCGFVFKDPKTCAYVGAETLCDHHLKSSGGCDGRNNTHHFGGMEHRYNPDVAVPGTGGNTGGDTGGGGGGGGGTCPRLDQYVRVKGPDGLPAPKMVCFFTEQDELWHPILRRFYKTRSARIIRNQPIWELITANGAVGYSSFLHPVIRSVDDHKGKAVALIGAFDSIMTEIGDDVASTGAVISRDTGELGDVMKIEMEARTDTEKIYCYGDSVEKMIYCHNAKPIDGLN